MEIICKSVEDCIATAEKILETYPEERVFAFYGKMGSGKTTLITALCKTLGVIDIPKSPSFAIINEYKIQSTVHSAQCTDMIYHFDFYRINKEEEAFNIGFEEYLYSNKYCFIEWSEKIEKLLPEEYVKVEIEEKENQERIINISLVK